jgi:hypothetical protein
LIILTVGSFCAVVRVRKECSERTKRKWEASKKLEEARASKRRKKEEEVEEEEESFSEANEQDPSNDDTDDDEPLSTKVGKKESSSKASAKKKRRSEKSQEQEIEYERQDVPAYNAGEEVAIVSVHKGKHCHAAYCKIVDGHVGSPEKKGLPLGEDIKTGDHPGKFVEDYHISSKIITFHRRLEELVNISSKIITFHR